MPTAFGSSIVSATFDPTNRPMYNPADITKSGVDMWIAFIEGVVNLIPGASEIVALVKGLTGVDLLSFERVFDGIDMNDPGSVLGAIEAAVAQLGTGLLQQLLAGIGNGVSQVGNSSTEILGGLLNSVLSIPGDLWSLIFGNNASQQSQINSLQSGGFIFDPTKDPLSTWNNLVGPLSLSPRGNYIQAATRTVWYRASGIASEKYGASFVIDPSMRGVSGVGICADSAGAKWVGLLAYRGFDGDALLLVTAASPTLWVTQKKLDLSGTNKFSGLTTLELKTDGVNKFWVVMNGKELPFGSVAGINYWTDTAAIASHDSSHRGVILVSNGLNRNEDSYYGPALKGKVVSYAA